MGYGLQLSATISILVSFGILFVLVKESLPFFGLVSPWDFFTGATWSPLLEPRSFGILPLIGGTLVVTGVATLVVIPVDPDPVLLDQRFEVTGERGAIHAEQIGILALDKLPFSGEHGQHGELRGAQARWPQCSVINLGHQARRPPQTGIVVIRRQRVALPHQHHIER